MKRQPPTQQSQQGRTPPRQGRTRRPQMFRTAVGLPEENRQAIIGLLNQSLADATDLMTQAKFAHWNVKGIHFQQLHLLFDEVAETLESHVDIIAERTTALGGEATGTARSAAANSRIPEIPPDVTTGEEYVVALVERVGIHANNLRADIEAAAERGDEDTADLYTELSREVDKQLYFLQAHLQAVNPAAIPEGQGGSMQGGTVQGGTVQGGSTQGGTMQGGSGSQGSNPSQGGRPSQYRQQSSSGPSRMGYQSSSGRQSRTGKSTQRRR